MSSSIALLTRNNFIAAMLTFHSEVDGARSVLTTEENIFNAEQMNKVLHQSLKLNHNLKVRLCLHHNL